MFSVSDKHQSEEVVQEFKDKAEPGPKPGMIYSYLGSTLDLACSPAAHHWDFFLPVALGQLQEYIMDC